MKLNKKGFTLIEIIVSLALICIIAVGIIPAFAAQLKMTIDTKHITTQTFEIQGNVEQVIQDVKDVLKNNTFNPADFTGVTKESKTIFGTTVDMYKVVQEFPIGSSSKDFIVYLSQTMAVKEIRTLLEAGTVYIDVDGVATATVADMKESPVLTGKFPTFADKRINVLNWYVSEVGNPDPVFPEDFHRLYFSGGSAPEKMTDLTKFANKFVIFTVTPVDYFGVRGNETRSTNTIYVIGEEWRGGTFAWVDINEDIFFTEGTDVKMLKSLTWPLTHGFTSQLFIDPSQEDVVWLDPSEGSLYVPMGVDTAVSPYGALNNINEAEKNLSWVVDKGINLASDITVTNSSNPDIYLKAMDGNIVLYQYIELDPDTQDAVFLPDGMPSMIMDGPVVTSQYGDITFETGGRGDVTIQNYSALDAGDSISLTPFGNLNIYQVSLSAGGSMILDTSGGSTYAENNRDIVIEDSVITLDASAVANRSIELKTLDALRISKTAFNGNTLASSKVLLTAPDGITMDDSGFNDSTVSINSNADMTGGYWNSTSTVLVADGKTLHIGASELSQVINTGALVLGNTGAVTFEKNMSYDLANELTISLRKGSNDNEVDITTDYGRNVGYAGSVSSTVMNTSGDFEDLGSGNTNLEFAVSKKSGHGDVNLNYQFDGDGTITITTSLAPSEEFSDYYTLYVRDAYAEDVLGKVNFRVSAGEGEVPVVTILESGIPTFTVTFDKNGGTVDASPATMTVEDGGTMTALPTPPTYFGHSFVSWNTAADGSGSQITTSTIVRGNLTAYAQYSVVPVYTVTFNKNGGSTEANPSSILVEQGQTITTLPAPPTRTGYGFNGWNTSANGSGTVFNATTTVTGNLTVYAQWSKRVYFADIAIGQYVRVNGSLFQKVTSTQLLSRNYIGTTTMLWDAADILATNYYTGFSALTWVSPNQSGQLSDTLIRSLHDSSAYRADILRVDYRWWSDEYWSSWYEEWAAYRIDTRGDYERRFISDDYDYYCRPYITVDIAGLYVTTGTGYANDPYELTKE